MSRIPVLRCLAAAALSAFAISPAHAVSAQTTIFSFCASPANPTCAGGGEPQSVLLPVGNQFYGTTNELAPYDDGELFQISMSGTLKTLKRFCKLATCKGGNSPGKYLAQAPDGTIYGVTAWGGGPNDAGEIFKLDTTGHPVAVYKFCPKPDCLDGFSPVSVVFDPAGDMFGTTIGGGRYREGTIFEITAAGAFQKLYDFCSVGNCADGNLPGTLLFASSGALYGTTEAGGTYQGGTLFTIVPGGSFTTLYSFCSLAACADGYRPGAMLAQGADGDIYGTTAAGGTTKSGTAFQWTLGGTLQTIYTFCSQPACADGSNPQAGLVTAPDGSFYGAASGGGVNGGGALYDLTTTGTFTQVYAFCAQANCADGSAPAAVPTLGSDGNLYGTTSSGGEYDDGTVYQITP